MGLQMEIMCGTINKTLRYKREELEISAWLRRMDGESAAALSEY